MPKPHTATAIAIALSSFAVILSGTTALLTSGILSPVQSASSRFGIQVRDYLLKHPEILLEALDRLEQREQVVEASELEAVVRERHAEIFDDPASPVGGNPDGDVVLAEFFDYNCPYCRAAAPILLQTEEADPELKLVYKEFPILGPGSSFAAQAALASHNPGKYEEFHHALMGHSGAVDESSTLEIAESVGLDLEQLQRDMQDPAIAAAIERNLALARDLRITGTPSFVVGDEIVRGLVDLPTLQGSVAEAREQSGE